jgi:large subunit ribosomal protein L30
MAETKKVTKKKKTASTAKAKTTLTVEYYRSAIGFNVHQKLVVKGLGFKKLNSKREIIDTPATRGMIAMVPHLVRVVE